MTADCLGGALCNMWPVSGSDGGAGALALNHGAVRTSGCDAVADTFDADACRAQVVIEPLDWIGVDGQYDPVGTALDVLVGGVVQQCQRGAL